MDININSPEVMSFEAQEFDTIALSDVCDNSFGVSNMVAPGNLGYPNLNNSVNITEFSTISSVEEFNTTTFANLMPLDTEGFTISLEVPNAENSLNETSSFTNEELEYLINPHSSQSPSNSENFEDLISFTIAPEICEIEESITTTVAPDDVCGERKRKRGRKPKSEIGMDIQMPKAKKPKRAKAYEIGPLQDKEEEKKRLNALNAYKHRMKQNEEKQCLEKELGEVKEERDDLKVQVESLRTRERELLAQVENFKKQALGLVSLLNTNLSV